MSIQILTATETLDQAELNRLRGYTCGIPKAEDMITSPEFFDAFDFTEEEVRDILSVEKSSYFRDGEYFIVKQTYRTLENTLSVIGRHKQVEDMLNMATGFVESDLGNMTVTFMFPISTFDIVLQTHTAMVIKATKQAFYSN